jgi:hypothetical protein
LNIRYKIEEINTGKSIGKRKGKRRRERKGDVNNENKEYGVK